jgi:hypothetical protein
MNLPRDSGDRTSGRLNSLRRVILNLGLGQAIAVFFGVYTVLGIVFGAIYASLPSIQGVTSGWDYVYFSFITQSTLGYGDLLPLSADRFVAVIHTGVGILLSSLGVGIITFKLIRRRPNVAIPKAGCYDPKRHTFVFRVANRDEDILGNVSVAVFITKPLATGDDELVRHLTIPVALEWEAPPFIDKLGVLALRSKANQGQPCDSFGRIIQGSVTISPLSMLAGDALTIYFSGASQAGGDTVFAFHTYLLDDIRCGIYRDVETAFWEDFNRATIDYVKRKLVRIDYESIEKITPTSDGDCIACPFHEKCQLDVANRVRMSRA